MAGVWSYSPQEIMAETLVGNVTQDRVSLQSAIVGRSTALVARTWRLRYTVVTTSQCTSMAAFFVANQGAFQEFQFRNPNDSVLYRARFDSTMVIEYFTPGFLRFGEIQIIQVL